MVTKKAPLPPVPGDDLEQVTGPGLDMFEDFVDSLPAEGQVKVSLKRTPSDLHPGLTMPASLFPPPRIGAFPDMQEEVARRFGPGEYSITVLWYGPGGRKDRRISRPQPFRIESGDAGPGEPLPDLPPEREPPPDLRATVARVLSQRADQAELDQAARLAGLNPAAILPPVDQTEQLVKLLGAMKAMFPPQAPVAPVEAGGLVGMFKEVLGFVRELAPDGGPAPSFWSALVPHLVDLMKSWGPYLPQVASALAQAKAAAGVPVVVPVPEMAPQPPPQLAGAPDAALAPLTGGDPMLTLALRAFLDMAFLECRKPHMADSARESYGLLADYCDANFHQLLGYLVSCPPADLFANWCALDARLATVPNAKMYCEGFRAYLAEPGPPDEGGTPKNTP